jgi:hypothetical protein
MGSSGHVLEIDRVDILAISKSTIACIVSKAVLDSDDNPSHKCQSTKEGKERLTASSSRRISTHPITYHKFVKTTPNPSATKNSSGELVGPFPPDEPLLELDDMAVVGAVEVDDYASPTIAMGKN